MTQDKSFKKIKADNVSEKKFFGNNYEDMQARRPNINEAKKILNWKPKFNYNSAIRQTVKYYIKKKNKSL